MRGDDCDKEWADAEKTCRALITNGNNDWRKVGRRPPTLESCMKGYVSERCGGNKIER